MKLTIHSFTVPLFFFGAALPSQARELLSDVPTGSLLEFRDDFRFPAGQAERDLGSKTIRLARTVHCRFRFMGNLAPERDSQITAGTQLVLSINETIATNPKLGEFGNGPRWVQIQLKPTSGQLKTPLLLECEKNGHPPYGGVSYHEVPVREVQNLLTRSHLHLLVPTSAGASDLPTDQVFESLISD